MVGRKDGQLRADAVRNRERIVAAAREVFSEHGLDVSMRQIARHAGVSEPTLRRRFADRDELLAAVFEDKVVLYAEVAEAALKQDDAWAGFTGFVRWVARTQFADRSLADVLTRTFPASLGYEQYRAASLGGRRGVFGKLGINTRVELTKYFLSHEAV